MYDVAVKYLWSCQGLNAHQRLSSPWHGPSHRLSLYGYSKKGEKIWDLPQHIIEVVTYFVLNERVGSVVQKQSHNLVVATQSRIMNTARSLLCMETRLKSECYQQGDWRSGTSAQTLKSVGLHPTPCNRSLSYLVLCIHVRPLQQ